MESETSKSIEIFICYAHEDDEYRRGLEKHLRVLRRSHIIDVWYDQEIRAGKDWKREIEQHLDTAQIILLLVSPDFIDSDYCYGIEMKRAMERHIRGEAHVIPIIVRHVYWQKAPFGELQALPTNATPVVDRYWHSIDEAFFNVAEGIRKVVEEVLEQPLPIIDNRPHFVFDLAEDDEVVGEVDLAEDDEDVYLPTQPRTPLSSSTFPTIRRIVDSDNLNKNTTSSIPEDLSEDFEVDDEPRPLYEQPFHAVSPSSFLAIRPVVEYVEDNEDDDLPAKLPTSPQSDVLPARRPRPPLRSNLPASSQCPIAPSTPSPSSSGLPARRPRPPLRSNLPASSRIVPPAEGQKTDSRSNNLFISWSALAALGIFFIGVFSSNPWGLGLGIGIIIIAVILFYIWL